MRNILIVIVVVVIVLISGIVAGTFARCLFGIRGVVRLGVLQFIASSQRSSGARSVVLAGRSQIDPYDLIGHSMHMFAPVFLVVVARLVFYFVFRARLRMSFSWRLSLLSVITVAIWVSASTGLRVLPFVHGK